MYPYLYWPVIQWDTSTPRNKILKIYMGIYTYIYILGNMYLILNLQ